MNTVEAIAAIEAAFPEEPLPEMTLRQAQLSEQGIRREITDEEWCHEGELDGGVVWTRIDDATLCECRAALSFLDDEGFVYYLPAYLRAALRRIASAPAGVASRLMDNELIGNAVFAVTHVNDNYSLSRLKRLNDPQIDAVIGFLQAVRRYTKFHAEDADQALREYWETSESRRRTLIYVP